MTSKPKAAVVTQEQRSVAQFWFALNDASSQKAAESAVSRYRFLHAAPIPEGNEKHLFLRLLSTICMFRRESSIVPVHELSQATFSPYRCHWRTPRRAVESGWWSKHAGTNSVRDCSLLVCEGSRIPAPRLQGFANAHKVNNNGKAQTSLEKVKNIERIEQAKNEATTMPENVIILGAAGRDFHDFMTYWSVKPNTVVKCFTGVQIPGISHRRFPPEMCNNDKNNNLYPEGLMVYPQDELEDLIKRFDATTCALAYSDLNYDTVQSLAARTNAAGCEFVQLPPALTQIKSVKPTIAICATRTGVGKSQTTRFIADYLKKAGKRIAVIRHPMPYDQVLLRQRCQRYETLDDMDKYDCTIEEREEYELHIEEGNLLFAGVDYEMILREAEKEADVILWDGGNNDASFYKPDLQITIADALRSGHEEHFYPGETNIRMADVVMINKVNALPSIDKANEQARMIEKIVKDNCPILFGNSVVSPEARDPITGKLLSKEEATRMVKGKDVCVIDDGPTLTHGGMPFGAGFALAKQLGAKAIVDPHPYAKGSLIGVFDQYKHLDRVLPAMGYGEAQIKDLEETVKGIECDSVVIGTPIDLGRIINLGNKPWVRARYCLEVVPEHVDQLNEALDSLMKLCNA